MRKFVAFLSSVSLVASGCTPIAQELRNPGGYPGYVLDRHMFDASRSKEMHLLRAAIILAMASRMGTATVRDGAEADSFATYLAAASDELNYAAANVYGTGSDPAEALAHADVVFASMAELPAWHTARFGGPPAR